MLNRILIITFLVLGLAPTSFSQIENINSQLNDAKDKFIVSYDLKKTSNISYFDIDLKVSIDGILITPSSAALRGDVGPLIKYGNNKRIIWDAFVDVERIDGNVKFEVIWRKPDVPAPPAVVLDYVVGGGAAGVGVGLSVLGLVTISKKGNIDLSADPDKNPIVFYYTYCDPSSPHYNAEMVIIEAEGTDSACDAHWEKANKKYKQGQLMSIIGAAVAVGGAYIIWKKPFWQPKMNNYLKQYGLHISPTFEWNNFNDTGYAQGTFGVRMTYQIGK
jgi:hypothetical protein